MSITPWCLLSVECWLINARGRQEQVITIHLMSAGDCWLPTDEAADVRREGPCVEVPLLSLHTEESELHHVGFPGVRK